MNIYKKLLNNSLIFAVGNLGTKFITLFLIPLYTFYLSPEELGLVDLLTITASLIIPVFTLSITNSVLRFVMDKSYDRQVILINSISITTLGLLLLISFFPLINLIIPVKEYVPLFYGLLITQAINTLLIQYVRAIGKVRLFAFSGILTAILLLIGNLIFLVLFNLSVYGFFYAYIISYLLSSVFVYIAGKVRDDLKFNKLDFQIMKEMLIFSVPLIPNTMMWWIMGVSDRYIITHYLGLTSAGLYAVAVKIPSILNIINSVFFQAWQMSAIEEANSKEKSHFYTIIFNVFAIFMILSTSLLLLFLKPIMNLIVSDVFYESWKYVPFLLLGIVFSSFSGFLGTNYIASKKTNGVIKTSLIGAILNIFLNLLLIPLIGINGAAISTMISFALVWILRIKDTNKFVDIKLNINKITLSFLILFFQIGILYSGLKFESSYQFILLFILIMINLTELKIIFLKFRKKLL